MSFCPQCRAPLDPNARFCVNCGYTLPAQAGPPAGPRPFAGAPPYGGAPPQGGGYGPPPGGGYGAPPQGGGYGPPPGPPGYGAPPGPPGYGPTPMAVAPAPADDGGGMKVLGGCGVAGCVGAGFAVLMGIGLIIVLTMVAGSGGGSSGGGSSGGGSGPSDVPSNGSVRDLIRPNVGPYRLIGTSPLEKVPAGVVDNIGAVYQAPDGRKVINVLLVYPTESIAAERIQGVWSSSLSSLKPGQKVSRGNVTCSNGVVCGTMVAVTGGNPESFYWNNRKLVVLVDGPAPHAKGFESNAPY